MKKITTCLLAAICLLHIACEQVQTGDNIAVISTEAGKVRGYVHNGVYTYKGISYAEAKRFEAPQKPKPWKVVRSSTSYGPAANQYLWVYGE